MTKKPFSFFLELLFVLFFFLIASTIFVRIYAYMMDVSNKDTYKQDAMVLASNEIENKTDEGKYIKTYHDRKYVIKINKVKENTYKIKIFHSNDKVLDYNYYIEVTS